MAYNLHILSGNVPADDNAAFQFLDERMASYYGNSEPPRGVMKDFYDKVVQIFPCLCSFADNDPRMEETPWSDGPLINNFTTDVAMVAFRHRDADRVVSKLVELAYDMSLTVLDWQTGEVFRPATSYTIVLCGVQDQTRTDAIAEKLAPSFKRDLAQMRQILTGPAVSIKKGLDFDHAQLYAGKLRQIGCLAEIRGDKDASTQVAMPPLASPPVVYKAQSSGLSLVPKTEEEEPSSDISPSDIQGHLIRIGAFQLVLPKTWEYSHEDGVHNLIHPETGVLIMVTELEAGLPNPRLTLEMQMAHFEAEEDPAKKIRDIQELKISTKNALVTGYTAEYLEAKPGSMQQRFILHHLRTEKTCIGVVCVVLQTEFQKFEEKYRNLFASFLQLADQIPRKEALTANQATPANYSQVAAPSTKDQASPSKKFKAPDFDPLEQMSEHSHLGADEDTGVLAIVNAKQRLWVAFVAILLSFIILMSTRNQEVFMMTFVGIGIAIHACLKIFDAMKNHSSMKLILCLAMLIPALNLGAILLLQKLSSEYLANE